MPYGRYRSKRRKALAIRPVHSEKEEILANSLLTNASTAQFVDIITAKDAAAAAGEIPIGATVKSVFVELHFSADTLTSPKIINYIFQKLPHNTGAGTPNTGDQSIKNQILKRGSVLLPKDNAYVYSRAFRLKIPTRLSRFGDDDRLQLRWQCTSAETVNFVGLFIYKHFS